MKAESLLLRYENLNDTADHTGSGDNPSVVTYNRVLSAWANMKNATGMEKALSLLNRMEKAQTKADVKVTTPLPDGTSYNICLSAIYWSGVNDAPELCEDLLNRALTRSTKKSYSGTNREALMELDIDSYNAVMRAWSRSGRESAFISMEKIFDRLLEQFSQHKRSTKIQQKAANCFNILLDTCADSVSLEKAGQLLDSANTKFVNKESWFAPSSASCNILLDHWANRCLDDITIHSAESAYQILMDMHRMHEMGNREMKPTSRAYSFVIRACSRVNANAEDRNKALQIAIRSFDQYRSNFHGQTNQVLYGGFLGACINLSSGDTRTKLVRLIFRQCCKDGMLDKQFFFRMKTVLEADKWDEIIQNFSKNERRNFEWSDLPSEWSRNVK